jgi:FixJ family two-component response regulator
MAVSRLLAAMGYEVRAFESAEDYLNDQDTDTPGCLLLDVCLPDLSGIELQRTLSGSARARSIVFMTGHGDIETSVSAMKAGAVDFLQKPIDSGKLSAAIEQALQRDAEQRLKNETRKIIEERAKILTPREWEVMVQVIRGRLNKQIAADLQTGEKTVKVHRGRVMKKMMARTLPQLVQQAMELGIAGAPALHPHEGRLPAAT